MNLKIYKRGQGYYTRLYSALTLFVIVVFGCYALYLKLEGVSADVRMSVLLQTLIPTGVCIVFAGLIFWLANKPNVADFLISAEGEVKKVSWSSRREIVVSTVIVMCVVAIMAVLLLVADFTFEYLFMEVFHIQK